MNYLAHAYLSFDDDEILVGNMIADHVKGRGIDGYPERIREGIRIHREIDRYTDQHEEVRKSKKLFVPAIGHYAPVIVDVLYDHFLGKNWAAYSQERLQDFTKRTYATLSKYEPGFPERFKLIFPHIRVNDWLSSYAQEEGLFGSFYGLSRRSPNFVSPALTIEIFKENRNALEQHFTAFFPQLADHIKKQKGQIG